MTVKGCHLKLKLIGIIQREGKKNPLATEMSCFHRHPLFTFAHIQTKCMRSGSLGMTVWMLVY